MQDGKAALVLFSGGQDSATCLAWALERYRRVETVGFQYGQRHAVEMQCRQHLREELIAGFPGWSARLGDDHVIDLSGLGCLSETAMTRDVAIHLGDKGLPNTFVPGRNLLFFTYAAALGWRRGIRHLIAGVCETDYSGYPDCRDDTVKAMQVALNLGMDERFVLHTPLMWLDKAETWALADRLGGDAMIQLIVEHSHTCYLGERGQRHDWGYGCGHCPACVLRADGWRRYRSDQ
ncbi:MAG: 7-cyano-7-deazaguanine synthase QueC [Ectothiorhodospiraceae bacterium]|nr:7-cyano-7-deazaguanine synthase QueC [Ectothiorhodospiraceae bacterium]